MNKYLVEVFDKIFEGNGGYYDPATSKWPAITEDMQFILNRMRMAINHSLANLKATPLVYIAFIDSPKFGAQVIKNKGIYFIGLYKGTMLILESLFCKMLRNPDFLPYLGDASKEDGLRVANPFIIDGITLLEDMENYPENHKWPKDNQRILRVKALTLQAILFLTLHELGHIIGGHLSYKASLVDTITGTILAGKLSGLQSQALECNADIFAAYYGIKSCHLPDNPAVGSAAYSNDLLVWGLAVHCLITLFGLITYEEAKFETYTHPPFPLRLDIIMTHMRIALEEEVAGNPIEEGTGLDDIREFVITIVVQGEIGFKLIIDDDDILKLKADSALFVREKRDHYRKIIDESLSLIPTARDFVYKKRE